MGQIQSLGRRRLAGLIAVCAAFSSVAASAEESAVFFLDRIDKGDTEARVYVLGTANGISWMNGVDGRYAYCQPSNLALEQDEIIRILRTFAASHPQIATYPVGLVMLAALKDRFPCADNNEKAGQ